jgi:hypothetical protein
VEEKGAFAEADARLSAMHGYAAPDGVLTCPTCQRPHVASMGLQRAPDMERVEVKLDALETLVRGLIVALRGGAVGKWT